MNDTEVMPAVAEPPDIADLPGALAAAAPRRWWNRATPVLLAVFLLAGGFLGGVQAQKNWGKNAIAPVRQEPRPLPAGERKSEATSGTLTSVTTSAITIRTDAGRAVTVRIIEGTKIQQSTTLAELTAGRPVTVQGSTATDGSITATAVTVS